MKRTAFVFLIVSLLLLTSCTDEKITWNPVRNDKNITSKEIVCWGDSMTSGFGSSDGDVMVDRKQIKRIYRMFIGGKTLHYIATALTNEGIPTPRGKAKWQTSTIESILTNEKYKGSAILQKKFTVDFLQKKMKVNEGEVPQYRVENSHPAIIEPDEWELVQKERQLPALTLKPG